MWPPTESPMVPKRAGSTFIEDAFATSQPNARQISSHTPGHAGLICVDSR